MDYEEQLARAILEMMNDAEQVILQSISKRLAKGLNSPGWRERQLRSVVSLRTEMQALMRALRSKNEVLINEAIARAYEIGQGFATGAPQKVGMSFGGVTFDSVQALADVARKSIGAAIFRIPSTADEIYQNVINLTASRSLAGVGNQRTIAGLAMRDWARQGITGFIDSRGRNWDLASYAEMVTRTTAKQAIISGHVNQLHDNGHDLVMISDAPEECKICRPWEGKVLSLSGNTAPGDYRDWDNGYNYTVTATLEQAKAQGLFHPNCRHRTILYIPGVTRRLVDTADPEGNKLRNEQRYRERKIRQYKREVAAIEPIDPAAAAAKKKQLRDYSAEFKAWREENGRKNLAYRTSLTHR